jgi:hypothetical protein
MVLLYYVKLFYYKYRVKVQFYERSLSQLFRSGDRQGKKLRKGQELWGRESSKIQSFLLKQGV